MWSGCEPIRTDKADFNKTDFEQYIFTKNVIITVR